LAAGQQNYIFESFVQSVAALAMGRAYTDVANPTKEFRAEVRAGVFTGETLSQWVMEYSRLLREDFGQAAVEGANSLQGSINKIRDAFELLMLEGGNTGAAAKINERLRDMGKMLKSNEAMASVCMLAQDLGHLAAIAGTAAEAAFKMREAIMGVVAAGAAWKGLSMAASIVTGTKAVVQRAQALVALRGMEQGRLAQIRALIPAEQAITLSSVRATIALHEETIAKARAAAASRMLTRDAAAEIIMRERRTLAILKETQAQLAKNATVGATLSGLKSMIGGLGGLTIAIGLATAAWQYWSRIKEEKIIKAQEDYKNTENYRGAYVRLAQTIMDTGAVMADATKTDKERADALARQAEAVANLTEKYKELALADRPGIDKMIEMANKGDIGPALDGQKEKFAALSGEVERLGGNIKDMTGKIDALNDLSSSKMTSNKQAVLKAIRNNTEQYKKELITLDEKQREVIENIHDISNFSYSGLGWEKQNEYVANELIKLRDLLEGIKNAKADNLKKLKAQITADQTPATPPGGDEDDKKSKPMSAEDHALIMLKKEIDAKKDAQTLRKQEIGDRKILTKETIDETAASGVRTAAPDARKAEMAEMESQLAKRSAVHHYAGASGEFAYGPWRLAGRP
jgi:archaellum component FlaC